VRFGGSAKRQVCGRHAAKAALQTKGVQSRQNVPAALALASYGGLQRSNTGAARAQAGVAAGQALLIYLSRLMGTHVRIVRTFLQCQVLAMRILKSN
jgi:hypothetical protein